MTIAGVYATVYQVKNHLIKKKEVGRLLDDDEQLQRFCIQASRDFDSYCHRHFFPRRQTRYYDHPTQRQSRSTASASLGILPTVGAGLVTGTYYADRLRLDKDLLEVITFSTQNGNVTISASDYFLQTGDSYNHPPYDTLVLKADGSVTALSYTGTPQRANVIDGIWGFHDDWSNAWALLDTVQNDPLAVAGTSVTVTDANGTDEQGLTPRFQIQQLLRFGTGASAEMAYVTKVDNDNDVLTVVRGVNGSTAAEQAQGTGIYVYRPMWEIQNAMLFYATYLYRRKDSVGGADDRPLASASGVMILPNQLPGEVARNIDAYKRIDIGGG